MRVSALMWKALRSTAGIARSWLMTWWKRACPWLSLGRVLAVCLHPVKSFYGWFWQSLLSIAIDRVISSLAKYDIPFDESESTESLRSKLAQFYAQRTLTKQPITPEDQAEAAYLLISGQLSKTTGQVISVDGGLHEAFLR